MTRQAFVLRIKEIAKANIYGDAYARLTAHQFDVWWANASALTESEREQALAGLDNWLAIHDHEDLAEAVDLAFGCE